jgi:hypothetical protein
MEHRVYEAFGLVACPDALSDAHRDCLLVPTTFPWRMDIAVKTRSWLRSKASRCCYALGMRWTLALRYLLPSLAGLVVAFVVMGPGQERELVSARVFGLVTKSSKRIALRVVVQRHFRGIFAPAGRHHLRIDLMSGSKQLARAKGASNAEGFAELVATAQPSLPLDQALQLQLSIDGKPVAQAPLKPLAPLAPQRKVAAPFRNAAKSSEGIEPIEIQLAAPRGFVVPEMPEELRLVAQGPRSDSPPRLAIQWSGVRLLKSAGPASNCTSKQCRWTWKLSILPFALAAEIDATVSTAAAKGRWLGALSVSPGSTWLDPEALTKGQLRLRAGSPRDRVFVSFIGSSGRIAGQVIALKRTPKGYFEATAALPSLPTGPLTVRIASDSAEQSASRVNYPLHLSQSRIEAPPLVPLIDGLDEQIATEQKRIKTSRERGAAAIAAIGLFQLLLLLLHHLRGGIRLQPRTEQPDLDLLQQALEPPSRGRTVVSALALAVAFTAMIAVALYV